MEVNSHTRSLSSNRSTRLLAVPLENETFPDNCSKLFNSLPVPVRICTNYLTFVNPRSLEEKIGTRSIEGRGGGGQSDPPPFTFDTIHPIDLKFGTYNKLHLYFQLSETTWCLIGFHGNNSQINDVTGGRYLGFSNFQILFKFSLLYLRLTGKQHLAVEIHEIGRIHCEVVKVEISQSTHRLRGFCDDVITCDVT